MAITRAQQARQMLKTAGAVEQDGVLNYIKNSESVTVPKEFKARKNAPATKLAYITAAEAKMLKEKKPGTPHKGPKGIPSYDSFGSIDASGRDTGVAGSRVSAAERGDFRGFEGSRNLPPGVQPKPSEEAQALRNAAIVAGAGQRVNPGFFDSRNTISPRELALAKASNPRLFRKVRGGGILGLIRSGGIIGNLIRNLGQRFGLGKTFDQPTYDMSRFSGLPLGGSAAFENLDIRDIYDRRVTDDEDDENKIPIVIDNDMSLTPNINSVVSKNPIGGLDQLAREIELLEATKPGRTTIDTLPGSLRDFYVNKQGLSPTREVDIVPDDINFTPFQKDVIEDPKEQDFTNLDDATFASALTTPTAGKFGLNLMQYSTLKNNRYSDSQIQEAIKGGYVNDLLKTLTLADGGYIGGGIMDAAGRQNYFLGKLVKKATRAVKKIVKSPIGKIGLLAAGGFGLNKAFPFIEAGKLTGAGKLFGGGVLSLAPLLFQQEEEQEEGLGTTGSVGGQIDPRAYTDPRSVMFRAFKMADGGRIGLKDGKGIMKVASNDANERLLEQLFEQFLEEGFSPEEAAKKAREAFDARDFAGAKGGDVEPVAKKTMPLLDMGGQEMDLRAEGGFVPIGRMEKADDVPARLSKNEFVFTADAVRNAGDGDVDKGAEVMYNMMKNLEAGGDVSEESQGLEGAREMFQTSKRLEEVI